MSLNRRKYECEVCWEDFPEHHLLQVHRMNKHSKPWERQGRPGTAPTMLGSASPLSVSSGAGLPPRIAAPRIPPPSIPALREQPGGPGTAPTMLGSASPLSVSSGGNDGGDRFTQNSFGVSSATTASLPSSFDKHYIQWLRAAAAHEFSLDLPAPGDSSRLYMKMAQQWGSQGIDPLTMSPSGPMSQRSNSNTITSITSNTRVGTTTATLPAGRTLSQGNQNLHDAAVRSSLDQLTVEMGLRNQQGSVDASGQQLWESRGKGPGPSRSSDK